VVGLRGDVALQVLDVVEAQLGLHRAVGQENARTKAAAVVESLLGISFAVFAPLVPVKSLWHNQLRLGGGIMPGPLRGATVAVIAETLVPWTGGAERRCGKPRN
jgi:hypothetical protein